MPVAADAVLWGVIAMLTLVTDPAISLRLIQQRRDLGIDLFDEVWEGMYVMTPAPDDEHQRLSMMLVHVLQLSFRLVEGDKRPKINVRHGEGERNWLI
jgi:hypothetical protein